MQTSTDQRWVLALSSVAAMMVSLDIQVVATALPVIRVHLHASLAALEWTVNAYTLSFAVLLLTASALGERLGRRGMLAVGVGLFTAASAACALAPDVGALVAARAVQGAGAALMLPLAMALLSAAFPPERRPWALGIFSSVTGIAVLAGPVLGGAVAQGLAWPWIFWLNIPIGVVLIPLILARMPGQGGERVAPGLDIPGLVLGTAGAIGLVWALIRGGSVGWASPSIVGGLVAGLLLAIVFVGWELRAVQPMLPVRLFALRPVAAGNAAGFAIFAALNGLVFFMAQFLQTGLGYSPLDAGLRLLPGWATLAVIAPFAGPLVARVGIRPLVTGGMTMCAAGLAWIALIGRAGLPYWQLVAPMLLAGCGVSLAMPAAVGAVMRAAPPPMIGKASGTYNTLRQLGGVFGVAICAAVFAARGSYASPARFAAGFGPALGTCAGLAAAAAVAGLFLTGRARSAAPPAPASSVQPQSETSRNDVTHAHPLPGEAWPVLRQHRARPGGIRRTARHQPRRPQLRHVPAARRGDIPPSGQHRTIAEPAT
jgi:EmrB/QacA subfamily drug resistance transporter